MAMASLEMVLRQLHRRKKQLVIILCVLVAVYNIAGDMLHNESPNNLPTRGYRKVEIANGSAHIQLISRRKDKEELGPNMNKYHGIDLMSLPTYTFDPAYKNPCWRENGTLRCLPYFFLIGVKKCGTTELYKLIEKHPDYITPDGNKEPGWFAEGRFDKNHAARYVRNSKHPYNSFDFYIDIFNNVARLINNEHNQRPNNGMTRCQRITGDGSTSNIDLNTHWPYLPGNEGLDEPRYIVLDYIHHVLPKAKIIIMFRNPIERLYSDYFYRFVAGQINFTSSPEHFHKEATSAILKYRNCFKTRTVRSCVYDDRIISALRNGIYSVYWQDLIRVFPRAQILVVHKEELHDMQSVLHRVFKFLEMRIPYSSEWNLFVGNNWNSRRPEDVVKGDMLGETRALLEDFYKPFNEEMFRATGDEIFLYNWFL